MSPLVCPECKFPNGPGAAVCLLCKEQLPPPPPDAAASAAALPPDPPTTRVEPALVEDEAPLAYLCCDPFAAIPITTDTIQLTMGRMEGNDLPLPHHSISRCHGVIRAKGSQIQFEDTSSNGSYLNGKRVTSATLHVGDVLTMGPYDIELRSDPRAHDDDEGSCTSEIDFSSIMTGLLEETSLMETLQGLEFNQKTGTLSIVCGKLRGNLVVRDGRPWFANLGDLRDEDAVIEMLSLQEGRFVFGPTVKEGPQRIQATMTKLLFEGSRRIDEGETQAF